MAQEQLSLRTNAVDGDVNGIADVTGVGGDNRGENDGGGGGGDSGVKTARLPRWTRQEILVLIQGKRVAENRVRRGRAIGSGMGFGSGQVEPKWASVSSYCKRHGVNRGPVQCRKRWSNLAGDFKKIKEWESQIKDETESYWAMRNDLRRERKLPGFFDREVFDILDGGATPDKAPEPALALALAPASISAEESEPVFAYGRSAAAAADEGLFSDFEQEDPSKAIPTAVPLSISVAEEEYQAASGAGTTSEKHPTTNPESGSTSQERRKRKRKEPEEEEEEANSTQHQLIDMIERSGKMVAAQLEAQNCNSRLDREQLKDFRDSLVAVLDKVAVALARIADRL